MGVEQTVVGSAADYVRTATRLVAAALGTDHPRTITAEVRRAECDRLRGAPAAGVRDLAARTARLFGPDQGMSPVR